MQTNHADTPRTAGRPCFASTQWSVVLAAGEHQREGAREALTRLCETYWHPLYEYARRRVENVHEAQDLTRRSLSRAMRASRSCESCAATEQQQPAGVESKGAHGGWYWLRSCHTRVCNPSGESHEKKSARAWPCVADDLLGIRDVLGERRELKWALLAGGSALTSCLFLVGAYRSK